MTITPPIIGFHSASTQSIANNFPEWTKIRQNYTSTGWKFINAWGMALESVVDNVTKNINNMHLATSDLLENTSVHTIELPDPSILDKQYLNILYNSSFCIKDVSRSKMPAGWTLDSGSDVQTIFTGYAPSIGAIASDIGTLKIRQDIYLDNEFYNKLYGSTYLKCATGSNVKVIISTETIDGTVLSSTGIYSGSCVEWTRLSTNLNISAQLYKATFTVESMCSGRVEISSVQLQKDALTEWSNSTVDVLPHTNAIPLGNAVAAIPKNTISKKIPLFPVRTDKELVYANVPTRIEPSIKPSMDLSPYALQIYGRRVSYQGEVVSTEWVNDDTQIIERSVSPTIFDYFGKYDIRELRFHEFLEYGTTEDNSVDITPLATAIRKDILYVACKEVYNGNTIRTIKILIPKSPPNQKTYLESIIDFDLNLFLEGILGDNQITNEEISTIGFSDVGANWLIINTTANRRFYYKLYFDYYYFNSNNNRIYCLEKYTNSRIAVI